MATATKAAQSGTAATEAAVAQVTETIRRPCQGDRRRERTRHPDHRCPRAGRQVGRGQDPGADRGSSPPRSRRPRPRAQELTETLDRRVQEGRGQGQGVRRGVRRRGQEGHRSVSVDTYQKAVTRYLELTVEFVDSLKNDAVSDLTRRTPRPITELVDASVSQAQGSAQVSIICGEPQT